MSKSGIFIGFGCLSWTACVVLVIVLVLAGVRNLKSSIIQLVIPAEYEVEFASAGTYTAFQEVINDVAEAEYGSKPVNPKESRDPKTGLVYLEEPFSGLTCSISSMRTGNRVHLSRDDFTGDDMPKVPPYFLGNRVGVPLFDFTVEEPGTYALNCGYRGGIVKYRLVLGITEGYMNKAILAFIIPVTVVVVFGFAGIVLIIIGFVKRSH